MALPAGDRAPLSVRLAAWAGLSLGGVILPWSIYGYNTACGPAAVFVSSAIAAAAGWAAGWLLLSRGGGAVHASRAAASVSFGAMAIIVLEFVRGRLAVDRNGPPQGGPAQELIENGALALALLVQGVGLRAVIPRFATLFAQASPRPHAP